MLRYMREHVKGIMITVIVLFVVSCFAGYGMYSKSSGRGSENTDYAVAEVDGKDIMRSDIEKGIASMAERVSQKDITSGDMPQIRKAVLDSMIVQEEIAREIKNRNIKVSDDDINAQYSKIMDSFPTREEFKLHLERNGVTEKQVKAEIAEQLSQQKLMESIANEIKVSDNQARIFYQTAKDILYKRPAGYSVNIAAFKNIEAAKLAQKAISDGANWDKIMDEHKADIENSTPLASPIVLTDAMIKQNPTLKGIQELQPNKASLLSIGKGVTYVAINHGKTPARVMTFDEVSGDVVNAIKSQMMQSAQNKFFKDMRDRAKVKILDEALFETPKATTPATSADKK
ncbi:MAG: SurA N-terminal domain-containing protein [Synergistaceae bacterium]|nr:SurA N-terminal domain-containing protein [Synergistaceae bacterium]